MTVCPKGRCLLIGCLNTGEPKIIYPNHLERAPTVIKSTTMLIKIGLGAFQIGNKMSVCQRAAKVWSVEL